MGFLVSLFELFDAMVLLLSVICVYACRPNFEGAKVSLRVLAIRTPESDKPQSAKRTNTLRSLMGTGQ